MRSPTDGVAGSWTELLSPKNRVPAMEGGTSGLETGGGTVPVPPPVSKFPISPPQRSAGRGQGEGCQGKALPLVLQWIPRQSTFGRSCTEDTLLPGKGAFPEGYLRLPPAEARVTCTGSFERSLFG